jgi:cytochrome c oxidase cbb3-type subunit 4
MYDTLRHFADSYGLITMVFVFLALCLWPLRPGAQTRNQAAAQSIFRDNTDGE